jgi:hypothetical protein
LQSELPAFSRLALRSLSKFCHPTSHIGSKLAAFECLFLADIPKIKRLIRYWCVRHTSPTRIRNFDSLARIYLYRQSPTRPIARTDRQGHARKYACSSDGLGRLRRTHRRCRESAARYERWPCHSNPAPSTRRVRLTCRIHYAEIWIHFRSDGALAPLLSRASADRRGRGTIEAKDSQ